jgi:epimerase transport system membrane fusion protein
MANSKEKPDKKDDLKEITPPSSPVWYIIFGLFLLTMVFGVMGGWMAYAPLAATSVAMGKVAPNTAKVPVQHLEGGIIDKIYAKDGQEIKRGDRLLKLDDIQIKAQMAQLNEQIKGLQSALKSKRKTLQYIDEDLAEWRKLFKQKLITKDKIRVLRREKVQVEGDISRTISEIAKAKKQKIILQDRLKRTLIRASHSGIIMGLDIHAKGEVVAPGKKIAEIVPKSKKLIIEAKINPMDIDKVKVGLKSDIIFPALDMKNVPPIDGKVTYISADSVEDSKSGAYYYDAKVEVTKEGIKTLKENNLTLVTGMPATVMIHIGERTMLEYLIKPFKEVVRKAFNEE